MRHLLTLFIAAFTLLLPQAVAAQQKTGHTAGNNPANKSFIPDHEYFIREGEVYFRFHLKDRSDIDRLTEVISIDNVKNDSVYAYASEKEFNSFLKWQLPYLILPHPGDVENVKMESWTGDIKEWDYYPTYDAYLAMMTQFASNYPDLCRIYEAGTSLQGRKILYAVISDSVQSYEGEPRVQYSSTMHGDETTGYVLMLRLIDYLLTHYNSDPEITQMINNMEIWINPLANPDGTYRSGNTTVSGARRYNANNVDLNRNFPDPAAGPHPDGNAWQPETVVMMNLAQKFHFVLSANFHGGAVVVNYPWDTWAKLHTDDSWYKFVCHMYADTARAVYSGYMNGFDNGITNGYAWYRVTGGRQDYFNTINHCREITIELSNTKLLSASSLPTYWNYNRKSLINFLKQGLYGIQGKLTDEQGSPVNAKVWIENHDKDDSEVYSDSLTGSFFRPVYQGLYKVTFSKAGFKPKTIDSIRVNSNSAIRLNVRLEKITTPVELTDFSVGQSGRDIIFRWKTATETNNRGFYIETGRSEFPGIWKASGWVEGCGTTTEGKEYSWLCRHNGDKKFLYRFIQVDFNGERRILKTGSVLPGILPDAFSLEQNFPNPFNPSTRISYQLPSGSFVTLRVYDVLGNEIANLVNEYKEAGSYSQEFNPGSLHVSSPLPSGVYFYRLTAGKFSCTRKMVIAK